MPLRAPLVGRQLDLVCRARGAERDGAGRRVVAEGKFPLPPADDDAAADDGAKEVVLHDKDDGPYHAHWISGALRQSFDTGAPLEAAFGADTV